MTGRGQLRARGIRTLTPCIALVAHTSTAQFRFVDQFRRGV